MLLLTDKPPGTDRFAHDFPVVVRLDDQPRATTIYSAIVCDVAFDDPARVDRLRTVLPRYRIDPSMPLMVLIRDLDVAAYARANALGATEIWSHEPSLSAYVAMPGRDGRHPTPIEAPAAAPPLDALVGTVASALEKMFGSAHSGERLAVDSLNAGADALVLAIKQAGISDWVNIVRGYDDVTYQHCLLVAGLVGAFSARLGMTFKHQLLLAQAALVHDIGKARVPHHILNKAGPLSSAEMEVMRKHPATGYYMIAHQQGIDPNVLDIVRHHHEYLDGSGYPDRLRKDEISEFCRMVTICDIYAALIERRTYKQPMAPREAYAVLSDMGPKLDARLLEEFHGLVEEMLRAPSDLAA